VNRLRTTLDAGAQRTAERVLSSAREEARTRGIHNAAVVLLDHTTSEVLALVGNFDFWDQAHGGQIPGFAVPRSPGSTLKPLLYTLALDQGLAGPDQLVTDVPTSYGTYAPRNFDGQFAGLVRLEDALSRSLNLPFVNLLQRLGVEPFLGSLRAQGVHSLEASPGHYGLSAAVGGIALTPLELAGLYAVLAQDGRTRPVRWWLDETSAPGVEDVAPRSYSEGAAWLTRQALALRERPDFPVRRRLTGAPAHIHWKTGTSFGHRDAWSVGSGPQHTAVVWMGNFDNAPSVHLTGAEAAGPILFDLLEGVADRSRPPPGDVVPSDLIRVEVCAYSGHVPSEACGARRLAWARRSAVPTEPCPYHQRVTVDVETGLAVNPRCRAGRRWEERTFMVWPATLRRWLSDQQRTLPEPPPWAPGCHGRGDEGAPRIVSPPAGQIALLLPGVPREQQELALEAEAPDGAGELSWFVDGQFVGTATAEQRVWWTPSAGLHEVLVTTTGGQTARRQLEVRVRR
jgi:penicillin-binding protein 1C